MSCDTAALGFAFGRGSTPDDAARFALYVQRYTQAFRMAGPTTVRHPLDVSDLFEDWQNLVYVERIERLLYGSEVAA